MKILLWETTPPLREFKFRLWNKKHNRWDTPALAKCMGEDGVLRPTEDCIIQQSTGIRDDDKREIYEGDIIQTYRHSGIKREGLIHTGEIIFNEWNSRLVFRVKKQGGYDLESWDSYSKSIIGHIFQDQYEFNF